MSLTSAARTKADSTQPTTRTSRKFRPVKIVMGDGSPSLVVSTVEPFLPASDEQRDGDDDGHGEDRPDGQEPDLVLGRVHERGQVQDQWQGQPQDSQDRQRREQWRDHVPPHPKPGPSVAHGQGGGEWRTAISQARKNGHLDVVRYLESRGARE